MTDVIVVGGGPAGSAAALRLAHAGARVTLLERARYPRHKPCAEYMSPGVVRALHAIGVSQAVERAAGARLHGFTVFAGGRSFRGRFVDAAGDRPSGLGIARAEMDTLLARAAAAAGAEVREGVRVVDLLHEGGRVVGVRSLVGGRRSELRAPLVIGADGVRSVVARRLGTLVPRRGMERIALVAHVGGIDALGDYGEMHLGADDYCGVAPLGGGVANVAMVLKGAGGAIAGRPERHFWQVLRSLPTLAARLDRAELVRPVMAIGPLSYRAAPLSTSGALLIGDAGGFYDPFTGQGVHRALVSAALAARVALDALAAGDLSLEHLRAYDRRRRARFRANHAVEWLVQQFIWRPALFDRAARRLAADPAMADTLVGVTGDILPPSRVLNPWFLARLAL